MKIEETQMQRSRHEKRQGCDPRYSGDRNIARANYIQFYADTLDNLHNMDDFLDKHTYRN